MPKNLFDIRLAVRRPDGFQSSTWRAWATAPGDVYLAVRSMAAIEKLSFHKSRLCRRAFTAEHALPASAGDRLLYRWRRHPAPEVGSNDATRVVWLAFPTDFLSRLTEAGNKPVVWIDAAPAGGATYLEFAFTRESEETVTTLFAERGHRRLLLYQSLPLDEAFVIDYYHADWVNSDLRMPGNGKVRDLLFSARDPSNTGRPVRLTYGPRPADGNALQLRELGGYPV